MRAWDVQELPTGDLLVTGREATMSRISNDRRLPVAFPVSRL